MSGAYERARRRMLSQARSRARAIAELSANPSDPRHGTLTGYSYGCRCDRCREARRIRRAEDKRKLLADPSDPRHGTTTGYDCGCRCDRCKQAKHEKYLRVDKATRIARKERTGRW